MLATGRAWSRRTFPALKARIYISIDIHRNAGSTYVKPTLATALRAQHSTVTSTRRPKTYLALNVRLGKPALQTTLTCPPLLTVTPATLKSKPFITAGTHIRHLVGTHQWAVRTL